MDPPAKRRSIFGGLANSLFGRSQASTSESSPQKSLPETRSEDSEGLSTRRERNAVESNERSDSYRKVDVSSPSALPRPSSSASFESPAKRATPSQLSSRRIIGRPQGPSSKLSQSFSASDLSQDTAKKTNFAMSTTSMNNSTNINGGSMRMPGDNPNKFSTISGSSFSRPTRPTADFSGIASTPSRNLFRASSLRGRPDFSFSPKVPRTTASQSFPPTTPGRPPRGSTAEINGRSLVSTNSADLFEMRIPSPPRDLTGERLAKEVPEDKNRVGSIYASEFLAHYCPPDFDDLQRRQFFCVLDLRRLKYAADEVFAKKDWKINIMNFAKEYEKSRSLIMLRYGLYEFKTVKASASVKKQWKKDNNIPLSDDELDDDEEQQEEEAPRKLTNGASVNSGKRKAEEELVPKDTAAKPSNLNKRPVTEKERERLDQASATSTPKPKRKADDLGDADENPPSKLQKAAVPASTQKAPASATKSIFEQIANGTPKESTTTKATSIFAQPKPSPANPFGTVKPSSGKSILDQSASLAPTSNIFGHLSDTSKASSNDDDEDDGDSDSSQATASDADGDADESEAQDVSQDDDASAANSGSVATPQFGFKVGPGLKDGQPASSASSSDAGGSTQGRSLFDRISYDKDGQPVRAGTATPQPVATPQAEQDASSAPVPSTSALAPVNKTWTTDTPIKFASGPAQPSSSLFGSASTAPKTGALFGAAPDAPKPAAPASATGPSITFEPPTPAKEADKPTEKPAEEASSEEPKPASASQSIFGTKPAAANPFGMVSSTPATSNPFGGSTATSAASIFGSSTAGSSLFGQPKPTAEKKSDNTPASTGTSLFGSKPASPAPDVQKPAASPLFGAQPATTETDTAKPAAVSIFGAQPAKPDTEAPKPAPFGNMFANTSKAPESKSPAPQPSSIFGNAATAPETSKAPTPSVGFSFGAGTPAAPSPATTPAQQPLFGATAGQSSTLFGGANAAKPLETKPLFGATPAASGASTPLFGATPAPQNEAAKPQGNTIFANPFGGNATPAAPAETSFKFGASQSTVPSSSFGVANTQPQDNTQSQGSIFGNLGSTGTSFTFNAGGTQQSASFTNPFAGNGSTSTPSSFNFGGNSTDNAAGQSSATPFSFGAGNAAAPTISFGAGSGASTPTSTQPTNMFGADGAGSFAFSGSQAQPGANSMFGSQPAASGGNIFTAGGLGTSTGTSKSSF